MLKEKFGVKNPHLIFAVRSKNEQKVLRIKMIIKPKISEKFLKKNLVEIKRLLPLQPQSNGRQNKAESSLKD